TEGVLRNPLPSRRNLSAPLVTKANTSASGRYIPVFVSLVKLKAGAEEVPLCNRPLKVPSPLPPSPLPSPSGLISSTHQALAPLTEKQSCPDADRYIPVDKLPAKANAGNSALPLPAVTLPKTVRLAPCPSSAAP